MEPQESPKSATADQRDTVRSAIERVSIQFFFFFFFFAYNTLCMSMGYTIVANTSVYPKNK